MLKRFLKNISHSFAIYLLAMFNLIHAIENKSYDWLLWVSVGLTMLSIILNLISAIKGDEHNA